jgi:hypothetical protein
VPRSRISLVPVSDPDVTVVTNSITGFDSFAILMEKEAIRGQVEMFPDDGCQTNFIFLRFVIVTYLPHLHCPIFIVTRD